MLPETLQRYLNAQRVAYVLEPRKFAGTPGSAIARADPEQSCARSVALADEHGTVLIVLPSNRLLDVDAVKQKLGRDLHPLTAVRAQALFQDCESPAWPPLASAYGLQAIVDVSLYAQVAVRFPPGRRDVSLRMSVQEFQRLMGEAILGRFSVPLQETGMSGLAQRPEAAPATPFAQEVANAISNCADLPVLPETASRVIELATDPNASTRDLARAVELDGALTASILRYANSPFYGYRGNIADVSSAITCVLGFDTVLGLAIGMSIGRSFRINTEGLLGLHAYRCNAVYCAALTQKLAQMLPRHSGVNAGTAYTAGLLHNFGQLFLGHVFSREHAMLETALLANDHVSMPDVERHLLGISHTETAAMLLHAWGLPDAVVTAVRQHHDPDYQGAHSAYARLVCVANRALAGYGLGINEPTQLPEGALAALGLSEERVREAAAALWERRSDLETLARLIA